MNIGLIQLLASDESIDLKALILLDLLLQVGGLLLQGWALLVLQAIMQLIGAFCSESTPPVKHL